MENGDYYCSCKSFRKDGFHEPWKLHIVEIEKNEICKECGYYAIYLLENDNLIYKGKKRGIVKTCQ